MLCAPERHGGRCALEEITQFPTCKLGCSGTDRLYVAAVTCGEIDKPPVKRGSLGADILRRFIVVEHQPHRKQGQKGEAKSALAPPQGIPRVIVELLQEGIDAPRCRVWQLVACQRRT